MIYINKKNLYIRVILALVVIASVWVSFQGGIDFVNAKATAEDVPEPFDATNPLTEKALQQHVTATALNSSYTVDFNKTVRTGAFVVQEQNYLTRLSNANTVAYTSESYSGQDVENRYTEQYETETMLYENKNGEITTTERGGDEYKSPILQNQFVNASYGINEFSVFTWTVTEVTDDKIVYDLARADAVAVPQLSTIENASGELVVNRNKNYIENIEVHIHGSSRDYPNDRVYIRYNYDVSSGNTDVTRPEWVPESSTDTKQDST